MGGADQALLHGRRCGSSIQVMLASTRLSVTRCVITMFGQGIRGGALPGQHYLQEYSHCQTDEGESVLAQYPEKSVRSGEYHAPKAEQGTDCRAVGWNCGR